MDPSCTIGFYCRNRSEFLELREKAEKVLAPPLQKGVYPFFTFIDQRADDTFTESFEQHLNSLCGHGATMSMSDPSSSLKKRTRRGNSSGKEVDDFIIEDDDDFVIVNRKPPSSKNLLSSITSIEDEFIMGDEEVLAGGGGFGFEGLRMMGEGEELQGKGKESELPQEESCLLQNGKESEVPQIQDDEMRLLQQKGVEPIFLPEERVEPSSLQQEGVELCLSQERGMGSEVESKLLLEPITLPEEEVEPQEGGVKSEVEKMVSHPLKQEGVEPYLMHQEGEESQLLVDTGDSSTAERGGTIPQELTDIFT